VARAASGAVERQSDLTWYSRLAMWIGAAMLLVQSIFGRDFGPKSLVAVLLMGVGLICFLAGLVLDAPRSPRREPHPVQVDPAPRPAPPAPEPASPASAPDRAGPRAAGTGSARTRSSSSRRPKYRERAGREPGVPGEAAAPHAAMQVAPTSVTEPKGTPADPEHAHAGVQTALLVADSVLVGQTCPRCAQALAVGQLAATCPVCGRAHHAVCWMENYFHCSTEGCTGEGSLEAVRPTSHELPPA
jgi:hypothetical protein